MRDVRALAKQIDGFTLEKSIQRVVKNAAGRVTIKTELVPPDKGIPALGAHIRAKWTIREILLFKSFTHGGTLSAPDGGWRIDYAGYVAATADGTRNLVQLFDSLHAEIWAYIGAAMFARMDCRQHKTTLMHNADDLMDMTINGLTREVKKKQSDSERMERIEALLKAHVLPRPADLEVTQEQLSEILEGLKAKVSIRQIQRWEQYIATNGKEGTKPPDGYTMQTRLTLNTAMAWAETFAATKGRQLRTKVSFEALHGGRH